MNPNPSKIASNRSQGKNQVDQQRESILEAAEKLFLQNGLENTSMSDIAAQAGITRVTLYRYFANRDEIAFEIHLRMMEKVAQVVGTDHEPTIESHRRWAQATIRNFFVLRDAFRYIGMFDKIYLDNAPDAALTRWTKVQLATWDGVRNSIVQGSRNDPYSDQMAVVMNTIVWFLEKLALRGELTWSDKDTPLEEHLMVFEGLIMGFFDRIAASEPQPTSEQNQTNIGV